MRVLLVTRNLPPLVGGMERLNWHMAKELNRFAQVLVVGPKGSADRAPEGVFVEEVPLRPIPIFLLRAFWLALRRARSWRPHWILAGSGLTAPIVRLVSRSVGARAGMYAHGLDLALQHPVYRLLWFPAIRRMDVLMANSSSTRTYAIRAGVPHAQIEILHPGVDIPSKLPDAQSVARFRKEFQLGDRRVLLSVGRLTERKGMREFVADVLPRIAEVHPDILLMVIGDTATHALHAHSQTRQSIEEAAAAHGVAANLRFLGVITDREKLSVAYASADLHVFPVRERSGDPEGFGMVAIEAAAHGLATVAYATGGVVDAVHEGHSGVLVAPGDSVAFSEAVLCLLRTPMPVDAIREHAEPFCWEHFGASLRRILLSMNRSVRDRDNV
ncbi:glycosyltransferase family 4 protein [Oleiagrimonas sp.]|jgi:phosphatidylinositol alpha-1,6-mannosyltransferase|uniref:glycosyltransferase family 4 protein n=1 Tax=Oleiagrimonas sp. TaxID=2010330 RepID=UPI00260A121D|nr:glycosyltransferase family 4 protein [Oleiagrimonas sp.]MDA3913385.1 glycosyltransferase family 4 protein [Oleiagrimonas sp.]